MSVNNTTDYSSLINALLFMFLLPTVGLKLICIFFEPHQTIFHALWDTKCDLGGRLWIVASFLSTWIITGNVFDSLIADERWNSMRQDKFFLKKSKHLRTFTLTLIIAGSILLFIPAYLLPETSYAVWILKMVALFAAYWIWRFDNNMLKLVPQDQVELAAEFNNTIRLLDIPTFLGIFVVIILAFIYTFFNIIDQEIRHREAFVIGFSSGAVAIELWFANLLYWLLFSQQFSWKDFSKELGKKILWAIGISALLFILAFFISSKLPTPTPSQTSDTNQIITPSETNKPRQIRIGIATWAGFASGMVGKEKGFFESIDLHYRIIDDISARHAAFRSGDIDIMISSVDLWVQEKAQGLEGKIFLVTDESAGGDGIVVQPKIKTGAELRGQKIAFARATPSHYLLFKVLEKNGLTPTDIREVKVEDPSNAGQAFLGGSVNAAVTWEPFLSQVSESGKGIILTTSRDFPGTIVDVLIASPKLLEQPDVLRKFVYGWLKSVDYIKTNPDEAKNIIAKGLSITPEDAANSMAGLKFANTALNAYYFTSFIPSQAPIAQIAIDASKFWSNQGIITYVPLVSDMISDLPSEIFLSSMKRHM